MTERVPVDLVNDVVPPRSGVGEGGRVDCAAGVERADQGGGVRGRRERSCGRGGRGDADAVTGRGLGGRGREEEVERAWDLLELCASASSRFMLSSLRMCDGVDGAHQLDDLGTPDVLPRRSGDPCWQAGQGVHGLEARPGREVRGCSDRDGDVDTRGGEGGLRAVGVGGTVGEGEEGGVREVRGEERAGDGAAAQGRGGGGEVRGMWCDDQEGQEGEDGAERHVGI